MFSAGSSAVQSATGVLLVRPARFGFNLQTELTNRFQQPEAGIDDAAATAASESEALRAALESVGVRVCAVDDTVEPAKPDAVFPNNWVSFHQDGTVVLYPLHAPNRRPERRLEIVAAVEAQLGYVRRRLLDLTEQEHATRILEGTGSLVLDHVQRVAYACRSARTDEGLLREWSRVMGFDPLPFDARGADGTPLYHTNVLMCIGSRWSVVCTRAIAPADRSSVLGRLRDSGREIIEIGIPAMQGFAGNMLEVTGRDAAGAPMAVLALSDCARTTLEREELQGWERLRACVDRVVAVPVPTIERLGGGSVRCMMAEVPERAA